MCRVYGWRDINERSSKGQVGSNFQQHPISNYSSQPAHSKNIYLKAILAFTFEISPFV